MRPTADDRQEELATFRCEVIPARELVRVVPIGELDLATVRVLDQALCELLEAGFTCLVLDLSRLTFLDSSGIHLIVRYQQRLEADDRQFSLIPGPSQVQRVLKITGLVDRLPLSTNGAAGDAPARISNA
ncbi:MAG: STAS domain-containing protein [Solirubrobacterales bacterium]|nr:STAS domain-containing protein [Solirubrobacterales bacterium]